MGSELGLYGKLPAHGDFVGRRLSNEFVQVWDDWLQRCIATSREQLGEYWLDIYLTSPIWRFALSAGIVDESVWAGLVMPSVDAVGRYFPFTVAARWDALTSPHSMMGRGGEWFRQLEETTLEALRETQNVDQLDDALAECDQPLWPSLQVSDDARPPWNTALNNAAASPSTSYPYLLDTLVKQQFPTYSLWWSTGSDRVEPCFLTSPGLPLAKSYAALLDGHWQHWQWYAPYRIVKPPASRATSE